MGGTAILRATIACDGEQPWNPLRLRSAVARSTPAILPKKDSTKTSIRCTPTARPPNRSSQGSPRDAVAHRLRQDGRSVRRPCGVLRRGHPAIQYHELDGTPDAQCPAVLRPVRARGDGRADPRQDRSLQAEGNVDGWFGPARLRGE